VVCGTLTCAPVLQAQVAGSVDLSYDPVIGVPGSFARVVAAMPQPDGKILVGGAFGQVKGHTWHALARLQPDGVMESPATFNHGIGMNGLGVRVVLQNDGRIVIAGAFTQIAGQPRGSIARLHANGALDTNFATGTGALNSLGNPAIIYGMAIQPDGRIIICGNFATVDGRSIAGVARLSANGSVEGIADFDPNGGAPTIVQCTAVQPDGKILVGGRFTTFGGLPRKTIARLLPNGNVESTATFNASAEYEDGTAGNIWAFALQPDGKILVAGQFQRVNGQPRHGIARLLPDGSLDSLESFNPALNAIVLTMALQADGKILVGTPYLPSKIGRFRSDGSVESTSTFNPGTGPQAAFSWDLSNITHQADGKILIGGTIDRVNEIPRTNLARLHNDPATQRLAATGNKIHWLRGGSAPEVSHVFFEYSATGTAPWTMLGPGTFVSGEWELSGLAVPATGRIRARGRTHGGQWSASSGLVENVLDLQAVLSITGFTVTAPPEGAGRRIQVTVEGGTGAASAIVDLQASAALNEWTTVATTIADNAGRAVFDYTDSGDVWRFFRVRLP
jgi:uncharacterized delta-60 repeat protein